MPTNSQQVFHLITKVSVDSTNDEAKRLIDQDNVREWTVITTEFQSKGKGMGSNSWVSDPGKNLLFSIILRPVFLPPDRQFYLNMAISMGIIRALVISTGVETLIKWPNDIYSGNRKLGGMLIQNYISGGKMQYSIAGVGLNVNQASFPQDLPNPVSLLMLTGHGIEPGTVLQHVLQAVHEEYQSLEGGKFRQLKNDYIEHLYLYGKESRYIVRGESVNASIAGVDPYGRLQLRAARGEILTCDLKEVVYTDD